nr:MAG TPA: hypothetical protein [Caudoviricetes sp.]
MLASLFTQPPRSSAIIKAQEGGDGNEYFKPFL